MLRRRPVNERDAHAIRVLGALAGALVLAILVVRFWPLPQPEDLSERVFTTLTRELITIEEIQQTQQQRKPPPPPKPLPPVPVPDDVPLPEDPLIVADTNLPIAEPDTGDGGQEGDAEETASPQTVETAPRAVRFVVGEYTEAAKRRGIRAEIAVEVLVDERGRVENVAIAERYRLDDELRRTPVDELGYGLEEAALEAARAFLFRPGRKNGRPVRTYTTVTLKFGV